MSLAGQLQVPTTLPIMKWSLVHRRNWSVVEYRGHYKCDRGKTARFDVLKSMTKEYLVTFLVTGYSENSVII